MLTKEQRLIHAYNKRYTPTAKKEQAKQQETAIQGFPQAQVLLMSAYNCWNSLATLRTNIRRNEEFIYGDQHSDKVYDHENHRYVTERRMYQEMGIQPSQYNIIRNIITRSIPGLWMQNRTLPVCVAQKEENQADSDVLTATLHALYRKLEISKLENSEIVQILASGIMARDINYANRNGEGDIVADYISPYSFFVDNSMTDPRYTDCSIVGYFYDADIDLIAGKFARGSKEREMQVRALYRGNSEQRIMSMTETFTDERIETDFFTPSIENSGLGRVIKVQRKETVSCWWVHDYLHGTCKPYTDVTERELKQLKAKRIQEQAAMGVPVEKMLLLDYWWESDQRVVYYWLTPWGDVLERLVSPYWHGGFSIVFELHEFFIGKIYPFAKDLIDTQKQVNRLSNLSEILTKHSAKDLVYIPMSTLADSNGYGVDYIQRTASKIGGVIPYNIDPKAPNARPERENTMAAAFTPLNVVNMWLKISENVSGVYGALQGAQPTSGTPAQMYAQQSHNSATSLNGIYETIQSYRNKTCKMMVQLMQQFYKGRRYIFDKKTGKMLLYDEAKVKNIDFELAIVENTDTPAYRLMVNDILIQLKQFDTQNQLDLRALLEAGNFPFKDQLLDYLNKREQEASEAMQNGMPLPGAQLPPELQQQLGQYQFTPEVLQQFENLPEDQRSMFEQAQ